MQESGMERTKIKAWGRKETKGKSYKKLGALRYWVREVAPRVGVSCGSALALHRPRSTIPVCNTSPREWSNLHCHRNVAPRNSRNTQWGKNGRNKAHKPHCNETQLWKQTQLWKWSVTEGPWQSSTDDVINNEMLTPACSKPRKRW